MNKETIIQAIDDCERFLKRAKVVLKKDNRYKYHGCKETAALRRASMDLTRSLTNMRKPG